MIPKRIHYCWFGEHPLGKLEQRCVESWMRICPDYEIVLWNEKNSPLEDNEYVQQAFHMRKWAFVSDYVRLKVISEYGGIYLDTDVEVLKPLDEFLDQSGFLGFESLKNVATCVIGSVKHHPFLNWLVQEYDKRTFCSTDGRWDDTTNTRWLTAILCDMGLQRNGMLQFLSDIAIYPPDIFCPRNLQTGKLCLTERSAAIHHFAGSWMTPRQRFHTKAAQYLGVENTRRLKRLFRRME